MRRIGLFVTAIVLLTGCVTHDAGVVDHTTPTGYAESGSSTGYSSQYIAPPPPPPAPPPPEPTVPPAAEAVPSSPAVLVRPAPVARPVRADTTAASDAVAAGAAGAAAISAHSIDCPALADDATPEECARLTAFLGRLRTGEAGFVAPARMRVGDTDEVSFAVTRDPAVTTVNDALGQAPAATMRVRLSRRMTATLSGVGFAITATSDKTADLGASGAARWTWQVTAQAGASHRLDLSLYADSARPGAPSEPHLIRVLHRDIPVTVATGKRIIGGLAESKEAVVSTTALLGAVAGLIGAAAAVWAALRRFRKPAAG